MNQVGSMDRFEYFIAQKNDIAIISLIGPANKDALEQLQECCLKVQGLEAQYIVVNLRDIREMKEPFYRPFAQMLAHARKKGQLRVSGLNPQHKEVLANLGLLRSHELSNNLNDAVQALIVQKKMAL